MFFDDQIIRDVLRPVIDTNIDNIFKTMDGNKELCNDIQNQISSIIKAQQL